MYQLRSGPFRFLIVHHPDTAKVILGSGKAVCLLGLGTSVQWCVHAVRSEHTHTGLFMEYLCSDTSELYGPGMFDCFTFVCTVHSF